MSQDEHFEFVKSLAEDLNRKMIKRPSFPDAVVRIRTALDDSGTTAGDIANILSNDAVLASRVLILANSNYHNPAGVKIESLESAAQCAIVGAEQRSGTMSMTDRLAAQRGHQLHPLAAIAIVIAVSGLAFAGELAIADYLPWGDEARGVVAVLLGAVVALWLTVRRGGTLADLGLVRPKRWWTVPFWVLGILVTFVAAQALVPQIIAPFFDLPAPDMSRYDFIRGNALAAVAMALLLPLTAAIPEEIVYRGFLMRQFTRLYGDGPAAAGLAVLSQALIFGSVHFQWGLGGVVMTSVMGLVWGTAYLLCGRNLWIVIMAHSAAHIALVLQLYSTP